MPTSFPHDPVQTSIAVAYHNPLYIADQILPRSQVGAEKFHWNEWPVEETYRLPDTKANRRGRLNEVQIELVPHTDETQDYGLSASIPAPDTLQAGLIPGYDPVSQHTMQLAEYVELDREVRVAGLVMSAAQYPASNKVTLAGNDQWSVDHDDSNPIADILAGMDAMLIPPNVLVLGFSTWQALRTHKRIIKALTGSAEGDVGIATREQVARIFEIPLVLVGTPRLNQAKFGQTADLVRVWGPHALLAHVNRIATADGQMLTFGLTAEFQTRVASTEAIPPGRMGLRGGTELTVGESVKELIIAPRAAFLIEDAVA